ncbi:hypothetical protein QBC46DRAFT_320431 [Diplogelasinospora grovesii]|uniref:ubiquitinyl hydrolase 1 n=1 Tax=Diplogelasinospora grovesii TaxID=303347 RepID=A0AAN6N0Q2_9PEZI|nr:hypothetical protein QBC46DRAFT_320431 [Diplogelasinospora grovesii]
MHASGTPSGLLQYLIHHVFLPPKLPQSDDTNLQNEHGLIQSLLDAALEFANLNCRPCPEVTAAVGMLLRLLEMRPGVDYPEKKGVVRNMIRKLTDGDHVLFHLRAQNAGILLTAASQDIRFEAFELLAPNEEVMQDPGRLIRAFPDCAVDVPCRTVKNEMFLDELVHVICHLELNTAPITRPKAKKAGLQLDEERDTVSPMLATDMLMSVLRGLGQLVEPVHIWKRSREQVNWSDAKLPFHRSPTWLLLRVALRLVLDRQAPAENASSLYKPIVAFFHGTVLKQAATASAPLRSDTLFAMNAKVARRLVKLNPARELPWLKHVERVVKRNNAGLQSRWAKVREDNALTLNLDVLKGLPFKDDSHLSLPNSKPYLDGVTNRWALDLDAGHGPGDNTRLPRFKAKDLPDLSVGVEGEMARFALRTFEAWVEAHLPSWMATRLQHPEDATATIIDLECLGNLVTTYHSRASTTYEGDAEALSLLYLTTVELWVAADKLTCRSVPLLRDYDTPFPQGMLDPLLLPTKKQMERLLAVETHWSNRKKAAKYGYDMAFANFGEKKSLAVQFFASSDTHQELHARIMWDATASKERKLSDLRQLQFKYRLLEEELSRTCHDQRRIHRGRIVCKYDCTACQLQQQMSQLTIMRFEWPLPEDVSEAEALVFELAVPRAVALWRNLTMQLLVDIFRDTPQSYRYGTQLYYASEVSALSGYCTTTTNRLQPASTAKPFSVAHYKAVPIREVTEESVCVPHGCSYSYYDYNLSRQSFEVFGGSRVPSCCSYAASCKDESIARWIRSTTHTSNQVIASQSDCPYDISTDEYTSLGNLRSGVRLQWPNILCQLRIPSLDLNKEATFFLIMQACHEAGPADKQHASVLREAHEITQDEGLVRGMVLALKDALDRVEGSWQNAVAACLLVSLATRLLSVVPSGDANHSSHVSELLGLLARLRRVSLLWANQVLERLSNAGSSTSSEGERREWIHRVLLASLICISTFDLGPAHLRSVLRWPDNLSYLIEASVLAQDHSVVAAESLSNPMLILLLSRWRRIAYKSEKTVRSQVLKGGKSGLDLAVRRFWAAYPCPSSTSDNDAAWRPREDETQRHILESKVRSNNSDNSSGNGFLRVTFNLLTGTLLVNGHPLSKLPPDYRTHPTFARLFGNQNPDVVPSTVAGMHFSASRLQMGWQVHFAMVDQRLVIRAVQQRQCPPQNDDTETWEYIPADYLRDDLPESFVSNYAHWRNLSTDMMEFRPIGQPWTTCIGDNWVLVRENPDQDPVLKQGPRCVLDPHSKSAQHLSNILRPIEHLKHIDLIFDRGERVLTVDLPRYRISFTLAQGESIIRSKHYAGMCIDASQCLDTLVGLDNKLVLTSIGQASQTSDGNGSESSFASRVVLVPQGTISSQITGNHVKASIAFNSSPGRLVRHAAFRLDPKLGRLVDSGALQNKLFLCMLHAVTAHCLPDPLTRRTGTEEALRILNSAAVRSFQRLDTESSGILDEIASLSPQRHFYPSYLKEMEQVKWSSGIPPLSQHDAFLPAVQSIMRHAEDCELFFAHEEAVENNSSKLRRIHDKEASSPLLVQRARIRNATFRVYEFGAEDYTSDHDRVYQRRDAFSSSTSSLLIHCQRVQELAICVETDRQQLVDRIASITHLRSAILEENGQEFLGDPERDVRFNVDFLLPGSLSGLWCGLHSSLAGERNRYRIIFFLAGLVFSQTVEWDLIQTLMALATLQPFRDCIISPPDESEFRLQFDRSSLPDRVRAIVNSHAYPFESCPEANWPRYEGETNWQADERRRDAWETSHTSFIDRFVQELQAQWSKGWNIRTPNGPAYKSYFGVDRILGEVRGVLDWVRKTELFDGYLGRVLQKLEKASVTRKEERVSSVMASLSPCPLEASLHLPQRPGYIAAMALFSNSSPPITPPPQLAAFDTASSREEVQKEASRTDNDHRNVKDGQNMTQLVDGLSRLVPSENDRYQKKYIAELSQSARECQSLSSSVALSASRGRQVDLSELNDYRLLCQETVRGFFSSIEKMLRGQGDRNSKIACRVLAEASMFPRISPVFLLQRLTRTNWATLSADWQVCLTNYAICLTHLQRAERLVEYSTHGRPNELRKELLNPGHTTWDPLQFPESLLLEVEQGLLIRPVQESIAAWMRDPPDGKSSALANGKESLVRVIVAKPQSKQMMHTLIGKLGGLLNRRIFYLPISRSVQLTASHQVKTVRRMLDTCRSEGGVLLVQPEHLLSFKLMGLESTCGDGRRLSVGNKMLNTYRDFESLSRDIVDESDENFNVKFELIYTMGSQQPVDMSPDRWTMIQEILGIMIEVAKEMLAANRGSRVGSNEDDEGSDGLLVEENGVGRVPTIRVLKDSAGRKLMQGVVDHVCRIGVRGLPLQHQPMQMREAVLRYILDQEVRREDIAMVEDTDTGLFATESSTTRKALLLLRGLLASKKGVLTFALAQKRYRVDYGLASPDRRPRTMVAVPYRAKDAPAPRSEFSHPDVVIILTCLSYYYRGLSDNELMISLALLLSRSDQAEQEYARWAAAAPPSGPSMLDPAFRHLSGVNLKDGTQCAERVFPALRHAKPAVDYYLSNVVFAKEMREFPSKLSASGWDLVKSSDDCHPLTGFSGTSDSKCVLPLGVEALDLPDQRHTNAAVLTCLQRAENTVLHLDGGGSQASGAETLIHAVVNSDQPTHVILDVGAQIIELSNEQVARGWLSRVPNNKADAVIFFDGHDELTVLSRDNSGLMTVEAFLTSPFATQTDRCLVFLDQAHTRGTDLKLPDTYRAAVTLGPRVTKDTLVQACMRMRKLGQGQAVTFCISPEIQSRIRRLLHLPNSQPLVVKDVLMWAISETWDEAFRSVPLWATQGVRHERHEIIWNRLNTAAVSAVDGGASSAEDFVSQYLEDEAQTLEKRYRPSAQGNAGAHATTTTRLLAEALADQSLESRRGEIETIVERCRDLGRGGGGGFDDVALQEEQERELAPENEQERQTERPQPRSPASHRLHPDVVGFVRDGSLKIRSDAFMPAFQAMDRSSAFACVLSGSSQLPCADLLVTADFARTVVVESSDALYCSDMYQRGVQWVLTRPDRKARHGMRMVVISPFEADQLKPYLLSGKRGAMMHAYLPRASLSFRSLEDLTTFTIPPLPPLTEWTAPPSALVMQLNLFAGQLYLRTYDEYVCLCRYLGLSYQENQDTDGRVVGPDGFVGQRRYGADECPFNTSPIPFLSLVYKKIRRDCMDITGTHLGRILAGEILVERDFVDGLH